MWVLFIAGSVTALPIISNFETPHHPGDGSRCVPSRSIYRRHGNSHLMHLSHRSLLRALDARVVSDEAITHVSGIVVAPIAGGSHSCSFVSYYSFVVFVSENPPSAKIWERIIPLL